MNRSHFDYKPETDMIQQQTPKEKAITAVVAVVLLAGILWAVDSMDRRRQEKSQDATEIHAQLSAMEAEATVRIKVGDAVGAIELLGKLSHPSQEVFRRIEGDGVFEDSRTVSYQEYWDGRRDSLLKVVTDL